MNLVSGAQWPTRKKNKAIIPYEDPHLPLAVVVAGARWDEPPRMRQGITRQLLRWFNVLFVEFFPTAPRKAVANEFFKIGSQMIIYKSQGALGVPPRLYANDPLTHGLVHRYFSRKIAAAVRAISQRPAMLINFVCHFPQIMEQECFNYRTYICVDEFPKMQRKVFKRNFLKRWYQAVLYQCWENRVAKNADRCFTPHRPLKRKLARVNKNVSLLTHGHDVPAGEFGHRRKKSNRIHVCFAGVIHYRLMDDWLLAVAQQKDMALHLIGPVSHYDLSSLLRFPNVYYHGCVGKDELYRKLFEMDVLVIPLNPKLPEVEVITTNSKTYQYVASLKPVVMSRLPNYADMPEGVLYKADSKRDFVFKIRKAHIEDCDRYSRLRRRIAMENTWDKRGDMLYSILKNDMAPGGCADRWQPFQS